MEGKDSPDLSRSCPADIVLNRLQRREHCGIKRLGMCNPTYMLHGLVKSMYSCMVMQLYMHACWRVASAKKSVAVTMAMPCTAPPPARPTLSWNAAAAARRQLTCAQISLHGCKHSFTSLIQSLSLRPGCCAPALYLPHSRAY